MAQLDNYVFSKGGNFYIRCARPSEVFISSTLLQTYFDGALTSLTFVQMLQFGVIFNVKYYCKNLQFNLQLLAQVSGQMERCDWSRAGHVTTKLSSDWLTQKCQDKICTSPIS